MSGTPSISKTWLDPLAMAYRRWGYLRATIDPLGRLEPLLHRDIEEAEAKADAKAAEHWRRIYCGPLAADFMHMIERDRCEWVAQAMEEPAAQFDGERALKRLASAELFEQFLHRRYVGSKRYSLEGAVGLLPLLDSILDTGIKTQAELCLLGMSHRGRLNVMVNVIGVPEANLFAGLEDLDPRSVLGSGDVKYHLGATGKHQSEDGELKLHLVSNPSHLEAVNPVLVGRAAARQRRLGKNSEHKVLPICLHGDAAFSGQGITSETLNMANIPGYDVGGTIHVIVNNLIGFTAEPQALHTARFSADTAKRLSIPIFRVNGEDPQALVRAGELATRFRNEFKTDVLIDLIAYRRHGHSEIEDPTTTSPLLYKAIGAMPALWEAYAERIGWTSVQAEELKKQILDRLSDAQETGRGMASRPILRTMPSYWDPYTGGAREEDDYPDTGVDMETLTVIGKQATTAPDDFQVHPKIEKLLVQRREMFSGERALDFAAAELLAFGSLLWDGTFVRLSGQDCRRGTFNHRHAVLRDAESAVEYTPLNHLRESQGEFQVIDSPLSEAAVLGFEYGYSRDTPDGLVAWEAQFGDFVNGAQIIIDQFIAAAEDKWGLLSGLVMLLPHGLEGQGPEHSSARLERFLDLAAQNNFQVCQPATAAQYFHLLRRQVLQRWRKPLVVFMPKGYLRAKDATSPLENLTRGQFQEVQLDEGKGEVRRILVCSGKVAHELARHREKIGADDTLIVRLNQLYPFPEHDMARALKTHEGARKLTWVQEEPANMGAMWYVRPRMQRLAGDRHVTAVKRSESASPATGSPGAHKLEQEALLQLAFS